MSEIGSSVRVDAAASRRRAKAVRKAFRRAGFEVDVTRDLPLRSAFVGDAGWLVDVSLAAPVAAFFASFGTEAGKDAYSAVKDWVRVVWSARRGWSRGEGELVLSDPNGTELELSSSIPDEALDALREIDWDQQSGAYLAWDFDHGKWRALPSNERP